MAEIKPAYLVHGDDDVMLDARREGIRKLVAQDDTGNQLAISAALHAPIEQTLVVCKRGNDVDGARAFAKLALSSDGQALLERYGFDGSTEQVGK